MSTREIAFVAHSLSSQLPASEVVGKARNLLVKLAKISPWREPFAIGDPHAHDWVPISTNAKEFEATALRCLDGRSHEATQFVPADGSKTTKVNAATISDVGFRLEFSNALCNNDRLSTATVNLHAGSAGRSSFESMNINVRSPELEKWLPHARAVFDLMLDELKPYNGYVSEWSVRQKVFDQPTDDHMIAVGRGQRHLPGLAASYCFS